MDTKGKESVSFGTCIVCQEDLDSSKGFGALALVQPSRLIRKHPDGSSSYLNETILMDSSLDRNSPKLPDSTFPPKDAEAIDASKRASGTIFDGFPQHAKFGLYSSVCSHMMHLDCFQVYNASIKHRHRAQGQRNHPESIARKTTFYQFLGQLINLTPLGQWFDYLFPVVILLPVCATCLCPEFSSGRNGPSKCVMLWHSLLIDACNYLSVLTQAAIETCPRVRSEIHSCRESSYWT